MTAIFAVWNNYGFSLASDSNQTGSKDNQTWVDPVEKIIMLENHQIAIGAAGNSFHSGVEVNEIFRSWEKSLPKEGFAKLDDYFVNFAHWFSKQTFNKTSPDFAGLGTLVRSCFDDISKILSSDEVNSDLTNLGEKVISSYERDRTTINFLGPDWELFSSVSDTTSEFITEAETKTDELRDSLISLAPEIESLSFIFKNEDELDSQVMDQVYPAFKDTFQREFDFDNDLDLEILNLTLFIILTTILDIHIYNPK